jgi:LmeA-like phospholipid-binding
MRKLLIAAVVLLILAAAADFAGARIFEDRVTDVLQREYDLEQRPVVQVRDFPFLPHLATGRFSTIDVAATDARAEGINAARLQLQLHDVRVPREVLLGEPGRITVDRADGRIELTEAEVNRLLADRLQGGALAIGEDGVRIRVQVQLLGQPLDALVTGKLGARDGAVTFRPDAVRLGETGQLGQAGEDLVASQFTFEVPLPELPAGVRLERIETRPGTLVLSGRAAGIGVAA